MTPSPGDVLRLGRAASVQFDGDRAIMLRVTAVDRQPTYAGWVWLTGYVLDEAGEAVERRQVYVQAAGSHPVSAARSAKPSRRPPERRPTAGTSRPAPARQRPVDLALP